MQKGKVVKVITQVDITQIGITQIGIRQIGITQIGITPTNQRPWEGTGHVRKSKNKSLRIFWSVL